MTPVLYLCLAIRTSFLNDVKLGILILITNMALKIQNDIIIRKTIKNKFANISAGKVSSLRVQPV